MVTVWVSTHSRVIDCFRRERFGLDDLIATINRYWLPCFGDVCIEVV